MSGNCMISLKSPFSFLLLCFCLSVFPLQAKVGSVPAPQSVSAPSVKTASPSLPEKKAEKPAAGKKKLHIRIPPEQQKFFRELAIVLDSIRKNAPHTAKKIDELLKKDSSAFVRHFLHGTKTGIVTITVTEGEKKIVVQPRKKIQKNSRSFYAEDLSKGRIKYIFLPDFSDVGTKKCIDLLQTLPAVAAGIVLDLRSCDDYTSRNADLIIRHLRKFVTQKAGERKGHSPVLAVICGKGTKGNGEVLIHILRKIPGVISVGAATHGQPFIVKPLPLKIIHTPPKNVKGENVKKKIMHILVPVIPEQWKDVPPASIVPQIRTETVPVYQKEKIPVEKDPALRVASDLLLSMSVLNGGK